MMFFFTKKVFVLPEIQNYVDRIRVAHFAKSILVYRNNSTALPTEIEEAAFILKASRGNWTSAVTAPILQYYASIDNLSVGRGYKIQFFVGPNWSMDTSATLRPFGQSLGRTRSRRELR